MRKITKDQLFHAIFLNGGPNNLDFSRRDLSEIDLSSGEVEYLIIENFDKKEIPVWATKDVWGNWAVNLEGADFENSNLTNANLGRANIKKCNFRNANLTGVVLTECDAERAIFSGATLDGSNFHLANLKHCRFGGASLRGAKLTEADFSNAFLLDANFSGCNLMKVHFGRRFLQEEKKELLSYFDYWKYHDIENRMKSRYSDARNILKSIKSVYSAQGYGEEAGKIHFREKVSSKWTHWFYFTKNSYPNEFQELPKNAFFRFIKLTLIFVKHMIFFLGDLIAEISCGYGEKWILPIFWSLLVIFLFSYLYCVTGSVVSVNEEIMNVQNYVIYSLGAFTGLGLFDFSAISSTGKLLSVIEAFLGISLVSLLMFVLGIKFSR